METHERLDDIQKIPESQREAWVGHLFIQGKRGKQRIVLFRGTLYLDLQKYIELNRLSLKDSDYFFHSTHAKRMTRQNFYDRIKKYCSDGGFPEEKFTPHQFRHAFGTHNLKNPGPNQTDAEGLEIYQLAHLMGHSHLKATMIYTRVNNEEKRQNFKKYHPRS